MIIGIHMDGVASYKTPAILETDKKLTLVYGLNGTGKSTLSNYLYNPTNPNFGNCKRTGLDDANVYVYNTTFVRENFYEKDSLKGIFTLSKANKEVEEKLAAAKKELEELLVQQGATQKLHDVSIGEKLHIRARAEEAVWPIKTKFTGGDRVLAYCLSGLQIKAKLFDHLLALSCPGDRPIKTADELKGDAEILQDHSAIMQAVLVAPADFHLSDSSAAILSSSIVGNENSAVAALIGKLHHADWVSEGVTYMNAILHEGDENCPFCQQKTINDNLANAIRQYFDETFTTSVQAVKDISTSYSRHWNSVAGVCDGARAHPLITKAQKEKLDQSIESLYATIELNKTLLLQKTEHPSKSIELWCTEDLVGAMKDIIEEVNARTIEHNKKLDDRSSALSHIKNEFWKICRWDFSREISEYVVANQRVDKDLLSQRGALRDILEKKNKIQSTISVLQLQVINVDHAVGEINGRLINMGIDSFRIEKYGENSYRLARSAEAASDFQTLSEGEKTVISFLYFMELCKGQLDPNAVVHKKILVIDDPISSLSHLYVFNIGRAIRDELCSSPSFEKIIVLTHSLYFFYELTDTDHKRRAETQKLIRLIKGAGGSRFEKMSYESIQNDYHAYWSVIKDKSASPALIANCMRNVIEYFFGFVKKSSLNNVFVNLKDPHHQAFYRYMNRESHSIGQNIYDFKEFDYEHFRESLRFIFCETGFEEHYDAMMA